MRIPLKQALDSDSFATVVQQIHELGQSVIAASATEVDKNARFPTESFDALKEHKLLSTYIPVKYGGMGASISQVAQMCEALGTYCGSTAMIFAMHQIQVACVVHHADNNTYFIEYMRKIVSQQRLLASATTEVGVGGDLRSSLCAVNVNGDRYTLNKQAPVISYGEAADDIMVTCRRSEDAPASDQVQVLVNGEDRKLEPISGWDTLGFRGTCSAGFSLTSQGDAQQVMPCPFADILSQTMHPVSHIVWGALWSGIAGSAVDKARKSVRKAARKNPDTPPISALRLAEVSITLQEMRNNIAQVAQNYENLLEQENNDVFSSPGFAISTNNLKLSCSELVVDIVGRAMIICGISGYRNDSDISININLRDAYGAAIMVNNDRILNHNASLQTAFRGR